MGKNRRIYLFRHGQTEWNRQGLIQGHSDIPLNDRGKVEALSLKNLLGQIPIRKIYSSDLQRAIETAEIVSDGRWEIETSPSLREAKLGEAEGQTLSWAVDHYDELLWELDCYGEESFWSFRYKQGESRLEVIERFFEFFDTIDEGEIAFSIHGGIMRLVIFRLMERFSLIKTKESVNIPIPNCALYALDFIDQKFLGYSSISASSE